MNAKKCKLLRKLAFNATKASGQAGTRYEGGNGLRCNTARRLVPGCTREVYQALKSKAKMSGFNQTLSLLTKVAP